MPGKGRSKKILAIDWDTRTLRVVHAFVGRHGVKIDRLLAVALPSGLDPDDAQQMGGHIRRVLDQERIATKTAVVDIPRDQVILNTLTLPTLAPDELPGMVEIQIAKELPFPVAEAVIDFAVEPASADQQRSKVLVSAIRREVLARYLETFEVAGLKLERIGLRPYAHKLAVCDRLKHAMPERVLFIDVRPTLTEIDVLHNGSLVFSRAASVHIPRNISESPLLSIVRDDSLPAGMSSTEQEAAPDGRTLADVVQSVIVEVTRSVEAYRVSDPGATLDHIVIGGDQGIEEELCELLHKRFDAGSEVYNPASSFGWEPDEGASAAAFAATLGLVLGQSDESDQHFDFLHPKKTKSVAEARLKMAPLVAAVVSLFVLAGVVFGAKMTATKRHALERIKQEIEELKGDARQNKRFLKLVNEVRGFDENQYVWVDVLFDALHVFPPNDEMVIDGTTMSLKAPQLKLKTRTKTRELAQEVRDRLNNLRREGREGPRFRAQMGPQSQKAKNLYPFSQELELTILDDTPARKRSGKR